MSVLGEIGPRTGTPQTEQADPRQSRNNAGGYSFSLDDWARLERFLILGVDAGTFYTKARPLAIDNAKVVARCLDDNAIRAVDTTVEISDSGRAPKNDPAIFAMAMAAAHAQGRDRALSRLDKVCRIGTHLFHFVQFVEGQRGWGRSLRRGVSAWYEQEHLPNLAYQVVKYRQRDGWTHRDLLRLAHPDAPTVGHASLYDFICGREGANLPEIVEGYIKAQEAKDNPARIVELVHQYKLPWEAIPPEALRDARVWHALLASGALPLGALVRNLGVMTHRGVLANMSEGTNLATSKLTDVTAIRKARLHPISILNALWTYRKGQGDKGKLTWSPVSKIIDALDAAFYSSFGTIEPANRRTMLAIDISGSMKFKPVTGAAFDSRVGAGAMAMVTVASEPDTLVTVFTSAGATRYGCHGWPAGIGVVDVSPRRRLDDNLRTIDMLPAGGTDCALPMLWAADNKIDVETFIVYTDNETWAGNPHPHQALQRYREKTGIPARLIVVGMTATEFTIADPSDPGMLDIVGFDTAAPNVMASFSAGVF